MKHQVILYAVVAAFFGVLSSPSANAHCQVPCGIYDDHARVVALLEDAATISKAVTEMAALTGKQEAQDHNQMVRWVVNKESHAQKIIATISDYFLTQRVKPTQEDYLVRLVKHHAIILAAMKAKQSADPKDAKTLVAAINGIAAYYPVTAE